MYALNRYCLCVLKVHDYMKELPEERVGTMIHDDYVYCIDKRYKGTYYGEDWSATCDAKFSRDIYILKSP